MKTNRITFLIFISIVYAVSVHSQTIWTGEKISFTKADNSDWTKEENQDRITDNVWLTRASSQGIFNIAKETSYARLKSPVDTEWAFGTTTNIASLTFRVWEAAILNNPRTGLEGEDMVLHLISDDIYIDINFSYWAVGKQGGKGGFTYSRSTDASTSINDDTKNNIIVSPNPANNYLKIYNLDKPKTLQILNSQGQIILEKEVGINSTLDISSLLTGVFFIRLESTQMIKFIKN